MADALEVNEGYYLRYLNHERQYFARALVEAGGFDEADAAREALFRYPYEPPNPDRGGVFHDLPWHWAMIRLHGHCFWMSKPELTYPPENFHREYMASLPDEDDGAVNKE